MLLQRADGFGHALRQPSLCGPPLKSVHHEWDFVSVAQNGDRLFLVGALFFMLPSQTSLGFESEQEERNKEREALVASLMHFAAASLELSGPMCNGLEAKGLRRQTSPPSCSQGDTPDCAVMICIVFQGLFLEPLG